MDKKLLKALGGTCVFAIAPFLCSANDPSGASDASEQSISASVGESSSDISDISSYDGGSAQSEEEEKKLADYIEELERKVKEISDTQFLGGTVGGLVSSAFVGLLYAITAIVKRKETKRQTSLFERGNSLIGDVSIKVEELHKSDAISEERYKLATKALGEASDLLASTSDKLEETQRQAEELKAKIDALTKSVEQMAKDMPDLVKAGTYSKIKKIESGEGE